MATIMIPTPLRKFSDNLSKIEIQGDHLSDGLQDLNRQYPDLGQQILKENGEIHGFLKIYLGEEDVLHLNGLKTKLNPSDVVSIIPAIAGGKR